MSRYAERTGVTVEKSKAEIERLLQRYGATGFLYGWNEGSAVIGFVMNARQVKLVLPLPDRGSTEFTETPSRNWTRTDEAALKLWEQACRERWRSLCLVIKAKLEGVRAGICGFDDEFLAYILLPDGRTTGQWLGPQIEQAYEKGTMPPLLGWSGKK
jgi:hypothetical protein